MTSGVRCPVPSSVSRNPTRSVVKNYWLIAARNFRSSRFRKKSCSVPSRRPPPARCRNTCCVREPSLQTDPCIHREENFMRPVSAFLSSLCLLSFLSFLSLSSSVWAGTISQHSFDSATLQRPYVYSLYTPDGYESSGLQYPVLYLLHGNLGTEKSWVEQGNLQSTADALIAAGSIPAQLIVVPADPNFWWSDTATEMSRTA